LTIDNQCDRLIYQGYSYAHGNKNSSTFFSFNNSYGVSIRSNRLEETIRTNFTL